MQVATLRRSLVRRHLRLPKGNLQRGVHRFRQENQPKVRVVNRVAK